MRNPFLAVVLLLAGLTILPSGRASAQIDIIGDIIKRVIMAIDLKVQRIQTRTIFLQDVQKQVENVMEETQLSDITDWVQRQKDLYGEYYQELWNVKSALSTFEKVRDLLTKQVALAANYKRAYSSICKDPHFSAAEINHIYQVYDGILSQSIDNIKELTLAINAFVTQMDDADRLHNIDEVSVRMNKNYNDLMEFTGENILLSLQRSRDQQDLQFIKNLYGIQ